MLGYVLPTVAWGAIGGKIGEALFTVGLVIDAPGFLLQSLLGVKMPILRMLVPVAVN